MRFWVIVSLVLLTMASCREAKPPQSKTAIAPATPTVPLTDWVIHPPIVDSETSIATKRIISTAPSITEMCCALGLTPHLVGRTRYCTYPPDIEEVTSIGSLTNANAELLIGLQPDLILVSGTSRQVVDRLNSLDLKYESLPDTTLDDIFKAIEQAGTLTDRLQTAKRLNQGIRDEMETITDDFASTKRRRVLLLISPMTDPPSPPHVAGPESFYGDLLTQAGHENAAPPSRSFAALSLEAIINIDPDVIIEIDADGTARPNGDADALAVWKQVGNLSAVRNKRIHVLKGQHLLIPGPRIAFTYEAICRAIAGADDD